MKISKGGMITVVVFWFIVIPTVSLYIYEPGVLRTIAEQILIIAAGYIITAIVYNVYNYIKENLWN